jgi:hypothetical protein
MILKLIIWIKCTYFLTNQLINFTQQPIYCTLYFYSHIFYLFFISVPWETNNDNVFIKKQFQWTIKSSIKYSQYIFINNSKHPINMEVNYIHYYFLISCTLYSFAHYLEIIGNLASLKFYVTKFQKLNILD